MARGNVHPPELKAAAIRLHLEGKTAAEIGRALGIRPRTISTWLAEHDPQRQAEVRQIYQRTREELSDLIYGTVVDTLRSIRARAVATADPDWIRGQNASDLAELDATHWGFLVRFVGSFRPVDDELPESAAPQLPEPQHPEPDPYRNGTVESPD
jgi:transposase-like protein